MTIRLQLVRAIPDRDVEDVAADRTGHGHVAVSFLGDNHARNQVRYASSRRQERQSHYLFTITNTRTCHPR